MQRTEVEGWRIGYLLLCQIGGEFGLSSDFDLIDRNYNELVADAEKAADREDHCDQVRLFQINEHVFDLPD